MNLKAISTRAPGRRKSDLKQQAALLQAQKMEAISNITAGIAHDFNNMLTSILGYTEIAIHLSKNNPEILDMLESIHYAAKNAAGMAKELISISKPDKQEIQRLSLNKLIKTTIKLMRKSGNKNVALDLQLDENLPKLHGNIDHLKRVIHNLVDNAFQAMNHNLEKHLLVKTEQVNFTENTTVGYSVLKPGKYALFTIADNGYGISPENLSKIYEPYFTTKGDAGTGLGLNVVFNFITQEHKGAICVYSILGQGTTFKVYLPIFKT